MLTSMSYKGSPLPPCKWCARRSASLSHSPSWRSSRSHPSHVETPRHHSASRSRTHPSSQHSLRPLQGTAPRPRGPRCASRAAPASSTLPTTLSSCDGRPPAAQAGPRRPLRHYLRLCLPVTGAPWSNTCTCPPARDLTGPPTRGPGHRVRGPSRDQLEDMWPWDLSTVRVGLSRSSSGARSKVHSLRVNAHRGGCASSSCVVHDHHAMVHKAHPQRHFFSGLNPLD